MDKPSFIDLALHEDDRGFVYCVGDKIGELGIKRIYTVENYVRGQVRAWHGHLNGDTYLHCITGSVKVGALNLSDTNQVVTGVLSARRPRLFKVPAGWANGAESLTDVTRLLVLSTLSFDEVKLDDKRLPWDIVPSIWGVKNR